ncbi:MAG TPA: hypothetical protein VGQ83_26560 [Polyangia bacterium]
MHPWLRRLRHDLMKPLVWVARDLRELGAAPSAADLAQLGRDFAGLHDPAGEPVTARDLFARYRAEAPAALAAPALAAFARALDEAAAAVAAGPPAAALAAVLRLEPAFDELARLLEPHP